MYRTFIYLHKYINKYMKNYIHICHSKLLLEICTELYICMHKLRLIAMENIVLPPTWEFLSLF